MVGLSTAPLALASARREIVSISINGCRSTPLSPLYSQAGEIWANLMRLRNLKVALPWFHESRRCPTWTSVIRASAPSWTTQMRWKYGRSTISFSAAMTLSGELCFQGPPFVSSSLPARKDSISIPNWDAGVGIPSQTTTFVAWRYMSPIMFTCNPFLYVGLVDAHRIHP